MPIADLDGLAIMIQADPTDKDLLVQIPGARWNRTRQQWSLPFTWAACLQLRNQFGARLELTDRLKGVAWTNRLGVVEPSLRLREALDVTEAEADVIAALNEVEDFSGWKLRPFQRAAVAFLATARHAGLFDDMGSGKTATLIRTVQALRGLDQSPLPALVVCPNSLKHTVWLREFRAWAPELRVVVVDGAASVRRKLLAQKADVFIVNWELLRHHSRLAPYGSSRLTEAQRTPKELNEMGLRTVILDEAHRLCNVGQRAERQEDGTTISVPSSQQALAAWAVTHGAEFRYALTGTPVDRNVRDLWGILHAVRPDWFPSKSRFVDRYAETTFGLFGGLEILGLRRDREPEFRAITEPVFRRLPSEVTLPQLPQFRPPQIRHTPMTPKQRRAYTQMQETMLAQLNELVVAANPITQFTRLTQFAAASAEVDGDGRLTLSAPSAKVDDLVELLAELGDEPLVVGAESRQLIELAAARLDKEKITYSLVTGAIPPVDRAASVKRFQDGHVRVILLTFGAGAEGITLTRARYLLSMQRSWKPLLNAQFRKRVQRIGSEGHDWLQEIVQLTPDTVEERKETVLAGKEERIEEVLRDPEIVRRLLGG